MHRHKLKTIEPHFTAILRGDKTAEVRLNDRDYQIGDVLDLALWLPDQEAFGDLIETRVVTHILRDSDGPWLRPGYVMLSLANPS